ncbi:NCS1 family transporter [Alteribacillus sp. YIM 98480]|uniref:NCS1 family transporter n=1 Tax=Alteribacillus sp. YIM 98480 TaxID=2606599 RepID=UPI00131D4D8E|nr:NCS1 family transporter [Alteribacillus sp. YIM 98480]
MNPKDRYLKSPDLLPVSHAKKKISTFGFSLMWVGMAVVLAAFAIGGDGVLGLPLGWVVLASLIGSVAIGLFITIVGDIGIEHGLSFPVYMRAPFGTAGTHIPSLTRGVTASIWFGINTFFGSTAINGILNILTGFDNWLLCYAVFATAQLVNTAIGIKAVERFADLAAPVIIIISIWMYFVLSNAALEGGNNVWNSVEAPLTGTAAINAFLIVIFANMGFWATLAADIPSISRFIKAPQYERSWVKRNKGTLVGSVVSLPLVQTFMVLIGGVCYIALGNFDPVVALQETATGIGLAVLLLMIVFAQWSTNTSANVIPAATIFSNAGGPKVPFYVGVFMAGIVGTAVQPWMLFEILVPFLLVVGGILSAIVGILITDYYILRKRRVNVPDLYRHDGQYQYYKGMNAAGFLAWIIGGASAYLLMDYSFLVGFAVGSVSYYMLAKYWWFPKYKQAEIEDPDDEKYLGITVGRDWTIEAEEEPVKEKTAKVQTL